MSKIEVNEIDKQNGSTLTIGGSGTTVQLGTGASQTGFGRTGEMFGAKKINVEPDMVTLAKGIGGGFPLAAVVGKSKIMDSVHDAGIGSTFGASPISCAAALGVLDVFDNDNLLDKVNKQETIMVKSLETMKDNYEFIGM